MTEDEDRVANADQNALLRRKFDPVLTEPIPARMYLQPPLWIDHARAAAWVVLGIAIGLMVPYLGLFSSQAPAVAVAAPLPVRAARAHLVYTPEVRHPVEVDAKEKDHLVKWLSKRLDRPLKVPALGNEGFELLGGRLLPGNDGPVAQFMYQDASGKRLTLYVTQRHKGDELTAFRFAREGGVQVFYWIDDDCGYALTGEIDKQTLNRIASSVYKQLER
jgi:anti-sigma factor RsiW